MAYYSDKAAAIKNMINELNLSKDNPEGIILRAMSDLLSEICESIAFLGDEDINVMLDDASGGDIRLICPNCGQTVLVDEQQMEDDGFIQCPKCNETVVISTSGS